MNLQGTWGNIHLTTPGTMMFSFLLVSCDNNVTQNTVPPIPAVSAIKVLVELIGQWDNSNSRVRTVENVQLRLRIPRHIDKVDYTDDQEMKKGQVLFTIDDRTYRVVLEQAQAVLARTETQASLAQSEASRADKLVHTNLVSREEREQCRPAMVQTRADTRAAQATMDAAQLNLDLTKVTVPIDGRASRVLITSGNLVTADDTASVPTTLVLQKTMYVYFNVDESAYLHYRNLARHGQGTLGDNQALPVEIGLVGEEGYSHQGKVDFLDNQLTPNTDTVHMHAPLDNSRRLFTPGLFVHVRLPDSAEFRAALIGNRAVLTSQDRKCVYIVNKGGEAQRRDVIPGRLADGLRIVQKGLNPGDSVIISGLQKVFIPGMPVNTKTAAMTTSAALS